jgi:hypothetical protein
MRRLPTHVHHPLGERDLARISEDAPKTSKSLLTCKSDHQKARPHGNQDSWSAGSPPQNLLLVSERDFL